MAGSSRKDFECISSSYPLRDYQVCNGPLINLLMFNSSNKNKAGDINSLWNLLVLFFFFFCFFFFLFFFCFFVFFCFLLFVFFFCVFFFFFVMFFCVFFFSHRQRFRFFRSMVWKQSIQTPNFP